MRWRWQSCKLAGGTPSLRWTDRDLWWWGWAMTNKRLFFFNFIYYLLLSKKRIGAALAIRPFAGMTREANGEARESLAFFSTGGT